MAAVLRCLFHIFISALFHYRAEAARRDFNDALTMADFRRHYGYFGPQSGSSGGVQSSGGVGSSGGVYASGRAAGGSSSIFTSGSYDNPDLANLSYAPGSSSGVTAGAKVTFAKPHRCNQCGGKFRSQRALYEHKRVHHSVAGDWHCYICNITFPHRKGFLAHLRQTHPEIAAEERERHNLSSERDAYMPFACPVCRKRYSGRHGLRDHMKSHTTDETACHLCPKVYSTRFNLKRHMTEHHPGAEMPEPTTAYAGPPIKDPEPGPFVCGDCGRAYIHKKHLKAHVVSHNTRETYCSSCDRTFTSKQSYRTHTERAHPEVAQAEKAMESELRDEKRPVKCQICNKGFKDVDGLRHHKKIHDGKNIICGVCGDKFGSRTACYLHRKKEH